MDPAADDSGLARPFDHPLDPHSSAHLASHGERTWGVRRMRVSRACDRCKKRKIRCTGKQPCNVCVRATASCLYTAPYGRGVPPPPTMPGDFYAPPPIAREDYHPQASGTRPEPEPEPEPASDGVGLGATISLTDPSSRTSPAPPMTDLQGHYVGPASGVSFLLRVQQRLRYSDETSSTFTFGDAPLPDYDPVPSVMVSGEETAQLVRKFFEYTMPIDRFFHRPTIEAWLQEFHSTMGSMKKTEDAPAQRAVLWMIFAMAQEHMTQESNAAVDNKSIRYFLAADYHLSKLRGCVTLAKVQAQLCQCYWLLGRSRMNHCWELFGSTARLALVLGLHRTQAHNAAGRNISRIDLECSRRTFWSAYYLDTYLTIALGRPRIFHDEDIDVEWPSGLDDDELYMNRLTSHPHVSYGYSTALAPVAFYKLSRIQSKVLRDLYSIRPISVARQCSLAAQYSQDLELWRADVPRFLDADGRDSAPLIPIFQRQRDVLNLVYWHTIILIHRPFLLRNFSHLPHSRRNTYGGHHRAQVEDGVSECLAAALRIVKMVDERCQSGMMSRSFWGTFYFAFSAAVVLYVYAIEESSSPPDTYQTFLEAASRCQSQLSHIAGRESLGARYCLVLEELRLEAKRRIEGETGRSLTDPDSSTAGGTMVDATLDNRGITAGDISGTVDGRVAYTDTGGGDFVGFRAGLAFVPADITSWLQFESMVGDRFTP
ncbi:Fungal specific transcription factor domain-containing protein [Pleurostoma richardsiae]|uniref:Fungal specific transcription factor domain-containing protein n=1 Tax=Pleurostoma richardsiae TaxID=41990 RepID=A0AA38VJW3_9PEZI|nr:Fungal specific transcription factor domain-containing protein [Pleurostoma richardsiae]